MFTVYSTDINKTELKTGIRSKHALLIEVVMLKLAKMNEF